MCVFVCECVCVCVVWCVCMRVVCVWYVCVCVWCVCVWCVCVHVYKQIKANMLKLAYPSGDASIDTSSNGSVGE